MILYLSSGTDQSLFEEYQRKGIVNSGFQTQKFNYLVISGLSRHTDLTAVANIPYSDSRNDIPERIVRKERAAFICMGNTGRRFHKLKNYLNMKRACQSVISSETEGIVCDAINPLASLLALEFARKNHTKAIAIVTDLPFYMDAKHISFFTRLTQALLEKYDGYVLLTEAMNPVANPKNKPHIVMEGLCNTLNEDSKPVTKNRSFVYAGSLSRGTGIEEMMNGFAEADLQDIDLDIYGQGILEDEIKRFSMEHPHVRFRGAVSNSEVVARQKEALLLVNPRPTNLGYAEFSFPSKVMEYMASGTPVLTTRLPGIPEEYFEYVYTTDEETSAGFRKAFSMLAERMTNDRDNYFKMGEEAKRFVMKNKNSSAQGERILNLLRMIRNEKA